VEYGVVAEQLSVSGRCLCGAVTFEIPGHTGNVMACHCSMCRRWSGGILLALDMHAQPVFTGADKIGVYKSSDWGERGFCTVCGSSLYWRLSAEDRYTVSAGTLNETADLKLADEIFIDDKPAYYHFANQTRRMTGAEAMAMLAGSGSKD
jgi:hypothetical protein